jgi:AcrR family transcriptional regulator
MPRISDAHREARRDQILDAAERCFARDGFHTVGMAEIVAEAGMSAGGVYRYFSGKDALIGAIVDRLLARLGGALAGATASVRTVDALVDAALDAASEVFGASVDTYARLLPQVWTEALRDPTIQAYVRASYEAVLRVLASRAATIEAEHGLPAGATPRGVAHLVLATMQGFMLQRLLLGPTMDVAAFRAAARSMLRPSGRGGTAGQRVDARSP